MVGRLKVCIKRNMSTWRDVLVLNTEHLMLLSGLVR